MWQKAFNALWNFNPPCKGPLRVFFVLCLATVYLNVFPIYRTVSLPILEMIPEDGFGYWIITNQWFPRGDRDRSKNSRLMLFEDSLALGPAYTLHDDICKKGRGRFSHWDRGVYFSTSDNTDPRMNGRIYFVVMAVRPPGWLSVPAYLFVGLGILFLLRFVAKKI